MLKIGEISGWSAKEIDAKVAELRTELFVMKMQKVSSGLEKPHHVKEVKKDIARLLTVKTSKGER